MTTLVIATRNRHKVQEIQAVLGAVFEYLTLADLPGAPAVVEDADTFAGNAAKKATELASWLATQPRYRESPAALVMADDSGLEVDALEGAPGVHSARFAALEQAAIAANSTDAANNAKLLRALADVPASARTGRFRCLIALTPVGRPEAVQLFAGACEGRILREPRGQAGFGYDPLFQPLGFGESFAELGEAVKNQISHRARALEQLRAHLQRTA